MVAEGAVILHAPADLTLRLDTLWPGDPKFVRSFGARAIDLTVLRFTAAKMQRVRGRLSFLRECKRFAEHPPDQRSTNFADLISRISRALRAGSQSLARAIGATAARFTG